MKICVTGGAGYIGSHTVVELLKNTEYDVIIVDNFSNSNPEIVNRLYELTKRPIKIYHRDCRDQMDDILSEHKVDGIIHFAAYKAVGESVESPIQYYDNNINSLLNMLDTAKYFGIKNFVFSSSCSLYGNLKELPATEDSPLSEPESPYAYTKLMGERILQDFSNANPDFKIISLRYFNPVGAHESGLIGESPINKPNNILPVICNSAETGEEMTVFGDDYETRDGSCIRDYVHVVDLIDAHIKALEKIVEGTHEIVNIGSGGGYTVKEVITAANGATGKELPTVNAQRRAGDPAVLIADISKAKSLLGWSPASDIKKMVLDTWESFNAYPSK